MSYRCGIGPGIPGLEPGPPRLTCDACGRVLEIKFRRGGPPAWLLDNRAAPKWTLIRLPDSTRRDFCPDHSLASMLLERDDARAIARTLAHSWVNDSRPPSDMVRDAIAYPAIPPRLR